MKREELSQYNFLYSGWQQRRIEKIEKIFGREFFKDKSVLELACGYGDIGKHFRDVCGSVLTFTEGREQHLEVISINNPGSTVIQLDQETNWNLNQKFDVLIHFGVMYHLNNWKQDLECAMKHSDLIILESEIADTDKLVEYKIVDDPSGYDQALNSEGICTRPSASMVEKVFEDNGFTYTRYDDGDLNDGIHTYDWKVTGSADVEGYNRDNGLGLRRFWVAKRK